MSENPNPESPTFNRPNESQSKSNYTDLNYWKTPIIFKESGVEVIEAKVVDEGDNVGINGTLRRYGRAKVGPEDGNVEPIIEEELIIERHNHPLPCVPLDTIDLYLLQPERAGPTLAQSFATKNYDLQAKPSHSVVNIIEEEKESVLRASIPLKPEMRPVSKVQLFRSLPASLKDPALNPSHTTLLPQAEEKASISVHRSIWPKAFQLLRALAFFIHSLFTYIPALTDSRVAALDGKGLIIAILAFSCFDFLIALIRIWPKNFWIFWNVRKINKITNTGTIFSLLADHELLLDIIPLFVNLTLRVYSYRLVELIADPKALNSIVDSNFSLDQWSNSKYSNLVQLYIWGLAIGATIFYHTFMRIKWATGKHHSVPLGLVIFIKALLLQLDIATNFLFFYSFLVSLGSSIFTTSDRYLPLMITIMVLSPVISTVSNSFINLPLLYTYRRITLQMNARATLMRCVKTIFGPKSSIFSLLALFYVVISCLILVQLNLVTSNLAFISDLGVWQPKQVVVWLVSINLIVNYLIGLVFSVLISAVRLVL